MEFTVFTTGGGFREFPGDSSYTVGEHNAVLYVYEGKTGQVIVYGPHAWTSIHEWSLRDEGEGTNRGGKRRGNVVAQPDPSPEFVELKAQAEH